LSWQAYAFGFLVDDAVAAFAGPHQRMPVGHLIPRFYTRLGSPLFPVLIWASASKHCDQLAKSFPLHVIRESFVFAFDHFFDYL
jgi:hypothetical protein